MDDDETPRLILTPVANEDEATDEKRTAARDLSLESLILVGRAVPGKLAPARDNAIFENKVLSRSHAEIWMQDGVVYIRDTRSSNGTYVNNHRLSRSNEESAPHQIKTGDQIRLGVDVVESSSLVHRCLVLDVCVVVPTLVRSIGDVLITPAEALENASRDVLLQELRELREEYVSLAEDFQKLCSDLSKSRTKEEALGARLQDVERLLRDICERADVAGKDIEDAHTRADRERLLEMQIDFYRLRMQEISTSSEDVEEANRQDLHLQEQYEEVTAAKRAMTQALQEKTEIKTRHERLQGRHKRMLEDHERKITAMKEQYAHLEEKYHAVARTLDEMRLRGSRAGSTLHAANTYGHEEEEDEWEDAEEGDEDKNAPVAERTEKEAVQQQQQQQQKEEEDEEEEEEEEKAAGTKRIAVDTRDVASQCDEVSSSEGEEKKGEDAVATGAPAESSLSAAANAKGSQSSTSTQADLDHDRLQEMQERMQQLQTKLDGVMDELENAKRDLSRERTEHAKKDKRLAKKHEQLEKHQASVKALEDKVKQTEGLLKRAAKEVTESTALGKRQEEEIASLKAQLQEQQEACAQLERQQWSFTSKSSLLHLCIGGVVAFVVAVLIRNTAM